jgi:hypothetical protein
MSTENNYRSRLETLAGAAPSTKAALIRSLLPGIEVALNSGQCLKDIWKELMLPSLAFLGHNAVYLLVGFLCFCWLKHVPGEKGEGKVSEEWVGETSSWLARPRDHCDLGFLHGLTATGSWTISDFERA